jgi:rhomboid protease GluP
MSEGLRQHRDSQEDIFDRMRNQPDKSWVNWILILVNLAVFVYAELTGGTEDVSHMLQLGAAYTPMIQDGEGYRLFTSMFLHFGIAHLVNNMLLLFFIGDYVERHLGKICYLILYLASGVFSGWFSMRYEIAIGSYSVSAGASGAIFGVVGGLLMLVVLNRGRLEDLTLPRMLLMAVFSLLVGFRTQGVDAWAHLGGALGGLVLTLLLWPLSKDRLLRKTS